MEASPEHPKTPASTPGLVTEADATRPVGRRGSERQKGPASSQTIWAALQEDARLRQRLQRGSTLRLRRQLQRALVRVAVLGTADVLAFAVMRSLLRAFRDSAVLGERAASFVSTVLPRGTLSGWQFAFAVLISLSVTGNYGQGDRRRSGGRLFMASALASALPLWTLIWARGLPVVFIEYAVTTCLVWAGLVAERFTIDRVVSLVRPPGRDAPRTLFVGPAVDCRRSLGSGLFRSGNYYRVLGFVDSNWPAAPDALGCRADLGRLIHETQAEAIVISGHFDDVLLQQLVDTALSAGCELVSVPRTQWVAGVRPSMVWRDGEALMTLTAPVLKGQQLLVKRIMDVVFGVLGLVAASPLMLVIALAVRLDSPGPVLFSQERVGFGGNRFKILKFRTMRAGSESHLDELRSLSLYEDPRLFKVVGDPRVTRVGAWLRRTSLDELPQLWNVVKGEMSLVGPRPPLPTEVALYESHHYARFDVKPGITGPWQVNGRNLITDFEQIVRLETAYIREWAIWKDLWIMLRTVPAVFKMQGAH